MSAAPSNNRPGRPKKPAESPRPAGGGSKRPGTARPSAPARPAAPTRPATPSRPSKTRRSGLKPNPSAIKRVQPRRQEPLSPQGLLELYRPDLARVLDTAQVPGFRYTQVLEHLFRSAGRPFTEASVLPAGLRAALDEAGTSVMSIAASRKAPDGTIKLLLAARDGAQVETVLMPYGNRLTACVSSQVGCAVGCAFCATGALGFRRNLSAAEIVDQIRASLTVSEPGQRLTNIVYMGMGEPLLNLGAVLDSIRLLTAPTTLGLGHRALSISTVGIPNGIVRLAKAEPQVNLAISLHAADDTTRGSLIPDQFRHPLTDILDAAWQHFEITGRKLLVEYVLLAGVNDSVDDARRLAGLLRGHVVTVNLLNWNPVAPEDVPAQPDPPAKAVRPQKSARGGDSPAPAARPVRTSSFAPSSFAAVSAFRAALRAAHIETVVRQSKGAGIEAACGQLAGAAATYPPETRD